MTDAKILEDQMFEMFISDDIPSHMVKQVLRESNTLQYNLTSLIKEKDKLSGQFIWLRDDDKPSAGFYEVLSFPKGAYKLISADRSGQLLLENPSRYLCVHKYDPHRPLVFFISEDGSATIENYEGTAKVVGTRRAMQPTGAL
jgi:hypothetical protein